MVNDHNDMTHSHGPDPDAHSLEYEAAALLVDALAKPDRLHLPGARERHRQRIGRAIDLAQAALEAGERVGAKPETIAGARATFVRAHAARAQDARHGAGQLSRGCQRAPTREACDDGWQRVESIVAVAESSSSEAERVALEQGDDALRSAAGIAKRAAREARRIVDERNHAYTFHTDPGFSFGEGWYLAAAAVLADVAIQIEPNMLQTAQAEKFLRDAGLGDRLTSNRPRPRANKQLPEIVAQAFRANASSTQRRLRAAFLGAEKIPETIVDWADEKLSGSSAANKILLWVRTGAHDSWRNTRRDELLELIECALAERLVPVLVGDAFSRNSIPAGVVDMTLFWKAPLFQGMDMRRAQLQFFEYLMQAHALVGQVGVTTAGMDGPALMGLPTLYLTDAPNVRLGAWVGAVPGYQEHVRGETGLERIGGSLKQWALVGRN
ncbi:MAG: hypothetical protein OSB70_16620 [Myxococcota bacterium]|nr:hypothetical protein [Myxococcota bacterium]